MITLRTYLYLTLIILFGTCTVEANAARWNASLSELRASDAPIKVGVITGVTAEAEELLKLFEPEYTTIERSLRNYYQGTLCGIDTVLVSSRCGKIAAAIAATTLILEHHVDMIIVTGVESY